MNIKEWATDFYNQHVDCSQGHDRGPVVDAMLEFAGARPGEAWCASFCTWCGHKAEIDAGVPEPARPAYGSASSQAIKHWAQAHDRLFIDANRLKSCTGALGGWTDDGDSSHGHVFLVAGRLTDDDGNVVRISTIEGNSDTTPDNAVNCLERDVPQTREGHYLWFVDLTGMPGHEYWGKL